MQPFPVGLFAASAPAEVIIFEDLFNGTGDLSTHSPNTGGAWVGSLTRLLVNSLDARTAVGALSDCDLDGSGNWRWTNGGASSAASNTLVLRPGTITTTDIALELVLGIGTGDDNTVIGMAARCNNSALSTRYDGAGVVTFINGVTGNVAMQPTSSNTGGSFTTNSPSPGPFVDTSFSAAADLTLRIEVTGTGASSQTLYYVNGVLAWTGIGTALQGTGDVRIGFRNQSSSLPTNGRPYFRSFKVAAL